jgi:DNA-binding transcriptional LysR family regulator
MNKYIVSPEDGLVVRAIHQSKSLREAAHVLGCDVGGLFRKVKRIADDHALLYKLDGKWSLTPKGLILLSWIEETIQSQQKALQAKTNLRLASTMWFSEQVLVPQLKMIRDLIPGLDQIHISVPQIGFEESLKKGESDFVVVCHAPYDPAVAYKKLSTEDWITVAPKKYEKSLSGKSKSEVISFLISKSFICHNKLHPNSALNDVQIENLPTFYIDNLIGVRSSVINNLGWSVVPRILVQEALENNKVIEIKSVPPSIQNPVCLWWLRERNDLKKTASILEQHFKVALSS